MVWDDIDSGEKSVAVLGCWVCRVDVCCLHLVYIQPHRGGPTPFAHPVICQSPSWATDPTKMPILGLKQPGPSKPAHFSLERVIRPNILALQPYRCARDDYSTGILLDANENALGPSLPPSATSSSSYAVNGAPTLSPSELEQLHRYPSPTHDELKSAIASFRGVPDADWVFLGVGSDEVMDLLFRVLCVPAKDQVCVTPPTYGMYKVCAHVNDVGVVSVPLITLPGEGSEGSEGSEGERQFQLDEPALDRAFDAHPDLKLLFICSPGNPTGTLIPLDAVRRIAENPKFKGVIVVDEAYVDFAPEYSSAAQLVNEYANVCVTQTLSKSFGLAAIRLGYLLAPPPLVQILTNTKAPYNVSLPTAAIALQAVSTQGLAVMSKSVSILNDNRATLIDALQTVDGLGKILGGNHANFVLVQVLDKETKKPSSKRAHEIYLAMAETRGVVVRYRGNEIGCEGCLRITVGTAAECDEVIAKLRELLP